MAAVLHIGVIPGIPVRTILHILCRLVVAVAPPVRLRSLVTPTPIPVICRFVAARAARRFARTPMLTMERLAEAAMNVITALAARPWLAAAVPGVGVLPAIHVAELGHIRLRVAWGVTITVRIR